MLPRYCAARHERTSRGWFPVPPPSPPPARVPRPPPPLRPPAGFYAAPSRRILLLPPCPSPPSPADRALAPPCQTHEPIDCRFCIICQDPNSLMHVPLRRHLTPLSVLFLYSPVTYSAVGVFFNNERNVSSTSDSFTAKNDFPRSDTRIDAAENNSRQYQQESNLDAITFYRYFLILLLLFILLELSIVVTC